MDKGASVTPTPWCATAVSNRHHPEPMVLMPTTPPPAQAQFVPIRVDGYALYEQDRSKPASPISYLGQFFDVD